MSTRRTMVKKLLVEAREALANGRGHLVVVGDSETTPHLPRLLAKAIREFLDPVPVPLAGSLDTVADCLAGAIREARAKKPEERRRGRQRLALLLPDALSIPTYALRSLYDMSTHLAASHRLVLFVDRDSAPFLDPAEELSQRIGVSLSKVELQNPQLELRGAEPVVDEPETPGVDRDERVREPAELFRKIEERAAAKERMAEIAKQAEPGEPVQTTADAAAPASEIEAPHEDSDDQPLELAERPAEAPETPLPRFAPPVAIPAPRREILEELRRARRRARIWRWTALAAVVAVCLATAGAIRYLPIRSVLVDAALPQTARPEVELAAQAPAPSAAEKPVTPPPPVAEPEAPVVARAPEPPIVEPAPEPAPKPQVVARAPEPAPKPAVATVRKATPRPAAVPRKARKASPRRVVARKRAPAPKARPSPPAPVAKRSPVHPVSPGVTVLVNLNADPWAHLQIDDRDLGPTPIGNVRLASGPHRVRARFPDGRVVERTIEVDAQRRQFQIR